MDTARWTRGMVAAGLLLAAAATPATAQDRRDERDVVGRDEAGRPGPSSDGRQPVIDSDGAHARGALQISPWMLETGRVGDMTPRHQASAAELAAGAAPTGRETPVRVHASQASTSKAVQGRVNQTLLDVEVQPYLRELRACPIEVARRRQVPLSAIETSDLDLSFTIQTTGAVTSAQALATGAPDEDLLSCIGQRMFKWRFTPPDGGPAAVNMHVTLQGARVVSARR